MPTYEYECKACGHRFERFQAMSEKSLTKCPKCKKVLRRIIGSGAGIIFKGSGFHATDYRKPSYKEREKKEKEKQEKPSSPCPPGAPSKDCASCPKNVK